MVRQLFFMVGKSVMFYDNNITSFIRDHVLVILVNNRDNSDDQFSVRD
jgi:hypothetical protein